MRHIFICGESNSKAYQVVKEVIEEARQENGAEGDKIYGYKPLLIYGPSGTGKTELLQILSDEIRKYQPGIHVMLKHSLDLVNEYVEAIKYRKFDAFLHQYMEADILLLDSIQLLKIWPKIAVVYTRILEELRQKNAIIVITADLTEEEWNATGETVYGPLDPCQIVKIELPDRGLRIRLIKMYACENALPLTDEMVDILARHTEGKNVRLIQIAVRWIRQYQEVHAVSVAQAVQSFLNSDKDGYHLSHL